MTKAFSILLVCSVLFGCSTPGIVLRKFELLRPAIKDTIAADIIELKSPYDSLLTDTIYTARLFRKGSTEQGSKELAATAKFNNRTKDFILEVPEIKDTITIHDTIKLKPTDIIIRGNSITEKIIWIISFMLTSIIIIIYKRYSNVRLSSK